MPNSRFGIQIPIVSEMALLVDPLCRASRFGLQIPIGWETALLVDPLYRADTRTYSDNRRITHHHAVRCKHCYRYCWPRCEYHRRATDTYEYYCESCWTWYWRNVYDFRMSTLAKTIPDWMLGNAGNRYNLLLGGDSDPTSLLVRRRRVHLYLLLTANGDLSWLLVQVSPHGSTTWQYHKSLIHRIIAMLVHGRPAAAVRRNEFDIAEFVRQRFLDGSIFYA